MKKRSLALALACALSLTLLAACGGNEEPTPAPETPEQEETVTPEVEQPEAEQPEQPDVQMPLDLSHVDVTLKSEGSTFVLSTSLPDVKVYFGSEDETIATVDENGTVTAVAPGMTTIMVETEDGRTAQCTVRCDWKAENGNANAGANNGSASVDLKAFYDSIIASAGDNAPFMMDVVNELGVDGIEMLYPGLTGISTKQQFIYMPAMSAVACEIAMVECANAADVEAVKAIFQARIDAQVAGGAWYPETIEGWEKNSDIVVNGNYVALFVIPEGMMDAAAEFGKLF